MALRRRHSSRTRIIVEKNHLVEKKKERKKKYTPMRLEPPAQLSLVHRPGVVFVAVW
jgi:hypothetical protein